MEIEQLIQIILLVGLILERLFKNARHCKSKCCCVEIEQDNIVNTQKDDVHTDIEIQQR